MEGSRGKQFTSFKSSAILSSTIKSHAILLHPARSMTPASVQHIHGCMPHAHYSHLARVLLIRLLQNWSVCVSITFIIFNNGPKPQA